MITVRYKSLVRSAGEKPCERLMQDDDSQADSAHIVVHDAPAKPGLLDSLKARWNALFRK